MKFLSTLRTLTTLVFALTLGAGVLAAEDKPDYVEETAIKEAAKKADGWDFTATVGSSTSFNDNRDVIGQPDGSAWLIGVNFAGAADMLYGKHEWRNSLGLKLAFARTPVIEEFVKSSDELSFETIYIYRFWQPWLGAFARFGMQTAMLTGRDVRAGDVTYALPNGETPVKDRLTLTDPFNPLKLKESAGLVYPPISKDSISIETRAGFGGRQVFADGQWVLADDDATEGIIEIGELKSYNQLGSELTASMWGKLHGGLVTYKLYAEAMTPFVHDELLEGDDRGSMELTNVELSAKLSFKLVSWASLDYEFKALREPQLLDEWQIQNNLLLTFSYSLIDTKTPAE